MVCHSRSAAALEWMGVRAGVVWVVVWTVG